MEHLSMQRMFLHQIDLDFAKTHYDKIVILKVFTMFTLLLKPHNVLLI